MKITIIGCGWVGLPLAKELVGLGYNVKGTTTSEAKIDLLKEAGISPCLLKLNRETGDIPQELFSCDLLVINIPPGRGEAVESHLSQVQTLLAGVGNPEFKCIYISSTGVYKNFNRVMVEEDVVTASQAEHIQIALAEDYLKGKFGNNLTIMRCGGLAGYDRNLARHFAGRENITEGNYPINHIHRDDVIGSVLHVINKNLWGTVFNVVSPEHPQKKDYYTDMCKKYGFALPHFLDEEFPYKTISVEKLLKSGYQFKYANPYDYSFSVN